MHVCLKSLYLWQPQESSRGLVRERGWMDYAGGGDGNFYKLENSHHHNMNWFAKNNLLKTHEVTTVEVETFGKLRLAVSRCSRTSCCCHTDPSLSCPSSLHPRHVRVRHANDAEVKAHHSFMKFDSRGTGEVAPQVRVLAALEGSYMTAHSRL